MQRKYCAPFAPEMEKLKQQEKSRKSDKSTLIEKSERREENQKVRVPLFKS
jgi:hypothetical protein